MQAPWARQVLCYYSPHQVNQGTGIRERINLDTFSRALECPGAELVVSSGVVSSGEATFHQLHGGVTTNVPRDRQIDNWNRFASEYSSIRGRPYEVLRLKHPPTCLEDYTVSKTLPARPGYIYYCDVAGRSYGSHRTGSNTRVLADQYQELWRVSLTLRFRRLHAI